MQLNNHRIRLICRLLACALAIGAPCGTALGATHVLLTQDQGPLVVTFVSLDGFSLRYTNEYGMTGAVPLQSVQALLPAGQSAPKVFKSDILQLVDGQRFPGSLAGGSGEQDSIEWQHDGFGSMSVSLDDIAAIVFQGNRAPTMTKTDDTVMLTNGDRLDGFVVQISPDVIFETNDGEIVEMGTDRISWLRIANTPELLEGVVVWLADGTVARLVDLRPAGSGSIELLRSSNTSMVVSPEDILALMMRAEDLTPLASILPSDQQAIGRPILLEPLQLASTPETMYDASFIVPDLFFPGTMQVDWQLPRGATQLGAVFELPDSSTPWGDCLVVILVDGREIERLHLHKDAPTAQVQVPLAGQMLRIRVEPGAYGPIQDAVYMRHPVVLHE